MSELRIYIYTNMYVYGKKKRTRSATESVLGTEAIFASIPSAVVPTPKAVSAWTRHVVQLRMKQRRGAAEAQERRGEEKSAERSTEGRRSTVDDEHHNCTHWR